MNSGAFTLRARAAVLSVLMVGIATTGIGAEESRVPVMIGGEAVLDACGSRGEVAGLKPVPGNTLTVRAGPGFNHPRLDELLPGAKVWICAREGRWVGVVYGADLSQCGVSVPAPKRHAYTGPCSSGWAYDQYIRATAG